MAKKSRIHISERNYGLDLLRILATIMVVVIHILVRGGIQANVVSLSPSHALLWFLGIAVDCAVNCFALISGYVAYDVNYKYTNIIKLHLTTLFYSWTITAIIGICVSNSVGLSEIINACFPVTTNMYWYYTAYFVLFFFMPLFNRGMAEMKKKQADILILAIIFLFSVIPTITQNDIFFINDGFSVLWLAALYLIGAYLKKYRHFFSKKTPLLFLLFISCIALTWLIKLGLDFLALTNNSAAIDFSDITYYTSPTILFAGIALVLLFSSLHIPQSMNKVFSFFVPATFSVYLIHEHPLVRSYLISEKMIFILYLHPLLQIPAVIIIALIIFLLCSMIDYARQWLFKLLHIDKELNKAEHALNKDY